MWPITSVRAWSEYFFTSQFSFFECDRRLGHKKNGVGVGGASVGIKGVDVDGGNVGIGRAGNGG